MQNLRAKVRGLNGYAIVLERCRFGGAYGKPAIRVCGGEVLDRDGVEQLISLLEQAKEGLE